MPQCVQKSCSSINNGCYYSGKGVNSLPTIITGKGPYHSCAVNFTDYKDGLLSGKAKYDVYTQMYNAQPFFPSGGRSKRTRRNKRSKKTRRNRK
jgi:hypothetical protein